jgi:hypothetical protein
MTITAAHYKAARQLLGWSQSRLGGKAGVSTTIVAYICERLVLTKSRRGRRN